MKQYLLIMLFLIGAYSLSGQLPGEEIIFYDSEMEYCRKFFDDDEHIYAIMVGGGIIKFDKESGKQEVFKNFDGIEKLHINALGSDKDGNLIAGIDGWLFFYDGNNWKKKNYIKDGITYPQRVDTIFAGNDGTIYVICLNNAGWKKPFASILIIKDDDFKVMTEKDWGQPLNFTNAMVDTKNRLWITAQKIEPYQPLVMMIDDDSLSIMDTEHFENYQIDDLHNCKLHGIAEDSTGNIWFSGLYGVYEYDGINIKEYQKKSGYQVLVNSKNDIFLISGSYVLINDDGEFTKYQLPVPDGIDDIFHRIWRGYLKNDTTLYIVARYGIYEFDMAKKKYTLLDPGNLNYDNLQNNYGMVDLPDFSLYLCYMTREGHILYNDRYSGFHVYDGSDWKSYLKKHEPSHAASINDIEFYNNEVYATSLENGIMVKSSNDEWRVIDKSHGLLNNGCRKLFVDNNNNLWLIHSLEGISKYNGSKWETYKFEEPDLYTGVSGIAQDSLGNIWVISNFYEKWDENIYYHIKSKVEKFDGTEWETFESANDTSFGHATNQGSFDRNNVAVTSDGRVWIITSPLLRPEGAEELHYAGLYCYDNGNWRVYDLKSGKSIIEEAARSTSSNGIVAMNNKIVVSFFGSKGEYINGEEYYYSGGFSFFDGKEWEHHPYLEPGDVIPPAEKEVVLHNVEMLNGDTKGSFFFRARTIDQDSARISHGDEPYWFFYDKNSGKYYMRHDTSFGAFYARGFKTAPNGDMWYKAVNIIACLKNPVTGVDEKIEPSSRKALIYPNPVNNLFTVQLNLEEPSQVRIELTDILGKTVKQYPEKYLSAGPHEFIYDRGGLSAGAYYLVIESSGGQILKKIVME